MTERDSNSEFDAHEAGTGWFVGIIVALALLSIGYLVFSANDCSGTSCLETVEASK